MPNHMVYLDHAATTRIHPAVQRKMAPFLRENFGNASTSYQLGIRAKDAMEEARTRIAECIGASAEEIYFTSGGSESDNWAIKSAAGASRAESAQHLGGQIITSQIEHHAVLHSCDFLRDLGYEVREVSVNREGRIRLDILEQQLWKRTSVVSIMYANNEIGTIQPVKEISQLARKYGAIYHVDAVQAVGHIPIDLSAGHIDLLSASGHKFEGPKGIGFLYVRKGVALPSFIHGGAQESGKRAGTENVASIVGMAGALSIANRRLQREEREEEKLRNYLQERILREIPDVRVNGDMKHRHPGILSVSFKGVNGTCLTTLLNEYGICASTGSACSTGQASVSHVLKAIMTEEEQRRYGEGTVRFSLGPENTKAEMAYVVYILEEQVKLLRGEA